MTGWRFHGGAHLPRCTAWVDRRQPFNALNLVAGGVVTWVDADGNDTVLVAGTLFWTRRDQHMTYGSRDGMPWDHRYITFDGDRPAARMDCWLDDAARPMVTVPDLGAATGHFDALLDALHPPNAVDIDRTSHEAEVLLLTARDALRRPAVADDALTAALRRLAEQIRAAPAREADWGAQADQLAVTPGHLRRRFKEIFGVPPHGFLLRARHAAAARLLRETDEPIKRIARTVGIPDVQHFGKSFRAAFGQPPATYRRHARELR